MLHTTAIKQEKGSARRLIEIKSSATRAFLFCKRRLSARVAIKIAVVIIAVAAAFFPLPARWIERFYSNGFYPWLQSWLTPLANLLPFALGDVLMVALVLGLPLWWAVRIRRAGRGRRRRAVALLALNSTVLAAAIFLSFQLLWGFNYMREPLTYKLEYDDRRITPQAEKVILRRTVEQLNLESAEARRSPSLDDSELRLGLQPSFDATVMMLGNSREVAKAIPKKTLFDAYLGATGVDGFTNPFGHEVLLNSDLLAFEKPFTLAHEWAHLAGYADESEANFVALLTCVRSDLPSVRYSGWLALNSYLSTVRRAHSDDAGFAESIPALAPEVKADLRAMIERSERRLSPSISRVQGEVYDRYLKANRVEAGIESYGLIVRLVLGTRFEPDWVPARRSD
jgi:hypothetical protein